MVLRRLTPQRVLCPCTLLHRASFIAPPAILSITSVSDRSTSPHALSIKIIRSMLKRMNSWAGVSRAGARTGLQLPGHGDMQGFNSSSPAKLIGRLHWVARCCQPGRLQRDKFSLCQRGRRASLRQTTHSCENHANAPCSGDTSIAVSVSVCVLSASHASYPSAISELTFCNTTPLWRSQPDERAEAREASVKHSRGAAPGRASGMCIFSSIGRGPAKQADIDETTLLTGGPGCTQRSGPVVSALGS